MDIGGGGERFGEGAGGMDTWELEPTVQEMLGKIESLPWVEGVSRMGTTTSKPRGGFRVQLRTMMELDKHCTKSKRRHGLWTAKTGNEASAEVQVLTKLFDHALMQ